MKLSALDNTQHFKKKKKKGGTGKTYHTP